MTAPIESQTPPSSGLRARFDAFYRRHEKSLPAAFFVAGFLFDVVTLGRIDDLFMVGQQALYLLIIGIYLFLEFAHQENQSETEITATQKPLIKKLAHPLWSYRELIMHFLFGSLLSVYTLFYFKSASFVSSFFFLFILVGLMIANELPKFQRLGPLMRFALFSLCLVSYFGYVIPIIYGSVGVIPFVLAVLASSAVLGLFYYFLKRSLSRSPQPLAFRWAFGVQVAFLILYFFQLIPPVPLSAQYMGIYHKIEKIEGDYHLFYDRPFWKFWQNGAQTFLARPGDRIYVFARIFSPTRFRDKISVRWLFKDPRQGWVSSDAIPMKISGGRDEGFRGYTFKQNYTPGDWRVQLETSDGREISRISFTVVPDTMAATAQATGEPLEEEDVEIEERFSVDIQ